MLILQSERKVGFIKHIYVVQMEESNNLKETKIKPARFSRKRKNRRNSLKKIRTMNGISGMDLSMYSKDI